ncbi:cytochrome c peroxidase [Stigmatella sp. ncwal1]|uniref:Cytochrome c peroxidase n=1 Tax=Stigmatella ashevillensis TaxID=2995309 RepID=A0ABT5DQ80_9BACT|nr:cytochrome c peroxidase [Stigmatella ashevillena]MDC0714542.1 cytochrome c peroxidase [Stigmatella ashevillena]
MNDWTRNKMAPLPAALVALGLLTGSGCSREAPPPPVPPSLPAAEALVTPPPAPPRAVLDPAKLVVAFKPAPKGKATSGHQDTEARIALGRMLFFDARLSKNHDISCNSCHGLDSFGVDNKPLSDGHRGQKGTRNSPTVYNAAGHIAQFWDGRASSLEAQAEGPLFNPVEMALPDDQRLVATLSSMPEYMRRFKAAFPSEKQPVTRATVTQAIASFERQLTTPSRFDAFLAGDASALSAQERRGLETFVSVGCTTCHNGGAVGGTSFQKLGLIEPWPHLADGGRFEVTKDEEDRSKFRVPTLRNVEKTAPYLHSGSVQELPEMVRLMARHQLGQTLGEADVEDVVAFLKSLTGQLPQQYISAPALPKSTPRTPKPDPS